MAVCKDASSVAFFIPTEEEEEVMPKEKVMGVMVPEVEEATCSHEKKLLLACKNNDGSAVKNILEGLMADRRDPGPILNLRNQEGTTPLHEACLHGSVDCIPVLLEYGREANIFDARGFAPIHCAAFNNHTDAMKVLLDYQPLDENCSKCQTDQKSAYGESPLHVACLQGHLEAVQFLCELDASLSCEDVVGNTFLHCISSSDSNDLWTWALLVMEQCSTEGCLLERCLPDLWKKKNMYGWTPAHIAASMGCKNSISALSQLKADFTETDKQGLSAIAIMNQRNHTDCYAIATNQRKEKFIPSKLTISSPLTKYTACRVRSNSVPLLKLTQPPSITGLERPITAQHSPSPNSRCVRRNSSSRSRVSSVSSKDSILNRSKENKQLKSSSSDDRMLQFETAYEPPFDAVPPICKEMLKPSKPRLNCTEHGIAFSSKLFTEMAKNSQNNEQDFVSPKLKEFEVCLAVTMNINMPFPDRYTIVSPICFVSCKCPYCPFSLTLPHAVDISTDLFNKEAFKILSVVTCDVSNISVDSPMTEFPPGKKLEEISVGLIEVYEGKLKFKTSICNPSLFAVGIENDAAANVPRPLPVLMCTLFCMFKNYSQHSTISHIPVMMYVGLSINTVRRIMVDVSNRKNSELKEVHFNLKEEKFSLMAKLTCSKEDWKLDTEEPQELTYCQVALTRDTDQLPYTHRLSYPPQQTVHILPKNMSDPATCEVSLLDTHLQLIKKIPFMAYAPYRSASHTPMGTPPPSLTSMTQLEMHPCVATSSTNGLPGGHTTLASSLSTSSPPHNMASSKAPNSQESETETIVKPNLDNVRTSVTTVV